MRAVAAAPKRFALHGLDPAVRYPIGPEQTGPLFAGLGTPTRITDMDSGQIREVTSQDVREHIVLIDGLDHIHNSQMDVWPGDIPMTTIHAEAIWAWAHHSRKSFGMGCYGYLPTWDMMRMMAIAVGGKEELRRRPRFLAICSVVSPLQMAQQQAEGLLICAEYGQPLAMSPEAIAGATAPATLAGLLVQENAAILAHIALCADLPSRHPGALRHRLDHRQHAPRHRSAGCGGDRAYHGRIGATGPLLRAAMPLGGRCDGEQDARRAGGTRAHADAPARGPGRREPDHMRRHPGQHAAGEPCAPRARRRSGRLCAAAGPGDRGERRDPRPRPDPGGQVRRELPGRAAHGRPLPPRALPAEAVRARSLGQLGERRLPDRAGQRPGAGEGHPRPAHPAALDPAVEAELQALRTAIAARSLEEFYSYELPQMQDLEAL